MLLRPASMSWLKSCYFVVIFALVVSVFAPQVVSVQAHSVAAPPHAPTAITALQFDGTNDYVTFGAASSLNAQSFTIETWFYWTGGGVTTSTGTGGVTAIPLVTKGRGESETTGLNVNYFLGISGGKLAADFEAYSGGQNYPVAGQTTIVTNTWHHAAATYNGTCWQLYLDGWADTSGTSCPGVLPDYTSTQHASIATAMTSSGTAGGYFQGTVDEVRIWNVVRTQQEIRDNLGQEVTSGTGLVARWGMNEGTGTTINGTGSGVVQGTLTNEPTWVPGSPFQLTGIFQEGVSGYAGTVDTTIKFNTPTTSYGSQVYLEWDTQESSGTTPEIALLQFTNIFGSGAGQIPLGSTIISASLLYRTYSNTNSYGNTANVYEPLVSWDESTTYNTFGGDAGVQTDEYNPTLVVTATAAAINTNYLIDVTPSLQRWSAGTANDGWVFLANGTDGVEINSSEYAIATNRPRLQVVYSTIPPTPPDAPTDLSATPTIGTQIDLAWTDNSANETSFEIERSTTGSSGPFSSLISVGADVTTYQDSGLGTNTESCYRVRATNSGGNSDYTNAACATTPINPNNAIDFGGTNAYVTFGDPGALDLAQFTIESWFRRDGTGIGASTGSGGIPSAVPLVTHGTSENDGTNVDMNYFLGIETTTNKLVADFEEGLGGAGPVGQNHPVTGTTSIQNGVWYHAAATYDGTTWRLYLNGDLEAQLVVGQPVRSDSIQHAALGSSIRSNGTTAQGFFDGVIDEARIWNSARTQAQIRSTVNSQLSTPQAGLQARWGLNEGSGTAVGDTSGNGVSGIVTGSNYQWTLGAPFNINFAPDAPTLNAPAIGSTVMTLSPTLSVNASDPDTTDLTVTFYGRSLSALSNLTFTLAVLPDTQNYSASYPQIFISQTQWIVDNRAGRNIAYVAHEGDIVNDSNITTQWTNADTAMDLLDAANIPYGVVPGNHDELTNPNNFNTYFGVTRFQGKSYYGGQYPAGDNQNSYALFSAAGLDFIVINLDYTSPAAGTLSWADALLKTYWNRLGIVVSHDIILTGNPGSFSTWGSSIYTALKNNPNLCLMLNGHTHGEGQRSDVYNSHPVHSLLADYQNNPNGGEGWLRLIEFAPSQNQIRVQTYSPYLNQFYTDADSYFTLTYPFTSTFQPIGTVNATSGSAANLVWATLSNNTPYEWYAVTSDGHVTTTGSINSFSVGDFAFADNDEVCAGNEPCYPTIQAALDHVTSGLVTVYDGAYGETLTLNKNATVSIANAAAINLTGFNMSAGTFNASNGTLNLTGDFTYSGGIFNAGTGSIGFSGGAAQNFNLIAPIVLNNLVVGVGTTLIETNSVDNATVNGTLSNSGTIRKLKSIGSGGPIGFGLTGVQMDVTNTGGGSLTGITIDRIDQHHPSATTPLQTGRYWNIDANGGASGFSVNLTLPAAFVPDDNDKVCRYAGAHWDCAMSSFTANSITRNNVTQFSSWASGNEAGPTAVELAYFNTANPDQTTVWPWLIACALLGSVTLGVLAAWGRRMNQHR